MSPQELRLLQADEMLSCRDQLQLECVTVFLLKAVFLVFDSDIAKHQRQE